MDDILPYVRDNNLVILTSDVTDFGALPSEFHANIVRPYDDTMPANRVASAPKTVVDTYPSDGAIDRNNRGDGSCGAWNG